MAEDSRLPIMTPPDLTALAQGFTNAEYLEMARDVQFSRVLKAMTIAACRTAEFYNQRVSDLEKEIKHLREAGLSNQ